jgi:hypothetical protein
VDQIYSGWTTSRVFELSQVAEVGQPDES